MIKLKTFSKFTKNHSKTIKFEINSISFTKLTFREDVQAKKSLSMQPLPPHLYQWSPELEFYEITC